MNKATMKRARNAAKAQKDKKGGGSQLKANQAALNIVCGVCYNNFMCTSSAKELEMHAENKHQKTLQQCFPGFK